MVPFQINALTSLGKIYYITETTCLSYDSSQNVFEILLKDGTEMTALMHAESFACNETAPGSPGPCSCNDCPACCVTPDIPDEPEPWTIMGFHASVVIVIFCYVIFVWAFGTSVIAWHLFCSQKQSYREGCCTLVDYYQNDRGSEDHSPIDRLIFLLSPL